MCSSLLSCMCVFNPRLLFIYSNYNDEELLLGDHIASYISFSLVRFSFSNRTRLFSEPTRCRSGSQRPKYHDRGSNCRRDRQASLLRARICPHKVYHELRGLSSWSSFRMTWKVDLGASFSADR